MGGIAAVRGGGDGGPDQGEGCGDGENQVGVKSIRAGSGLSGLTRSIEMGNMQGLLIPVTGVTRSP